MANVLEELGSRRQFKYIVVGCGGVGSAAVYWLSKKAQGDVLGLEQFQLGHDRGGSQDVSRAIRVAYHDDRYTRLAPAAYECWRHLESQSGQQLLFQTGGLQLGLRGSTDSVLEQYSQSMLRNNIPFERMTSEELKSRYPQFTTGPEVAAIFQKDSGLVDAAMANSTHLQLAQGNGALVLDHCPVLRIRRDSSGRMEVTTTKGIFTCGRVVVTAGAWLNEVLGCIGVQVPVTVTQEQVTYFATPHIKEFTKDKFPIWCYHSEDYDIYAVPAHGNSGTKIGIDAAGPHVTASTRTFTPDPARVKVCKDLIRKILPKFLGPEMYTKTCLYTMTPDRNFVIDTCARHGFPDVIVCCGAGHAFKFAGVLGKILSELALDGGTDHDISGFAMDRPALREASFVPAFHMRPSQPGSRL